MSSSKFSVTLKQLRDAHACYEGYNKVVCNILKKEYTSKGAYMRCSYKGNITLISILKNNGLDDAIWTLRCIPDIDRDCRLFAVWCARQVQHLMEDQRSINALDVAERFANGLATIDELNAARRAAKDAAWDAAKGAAMDAAMDASWNAAMDAAWNAAMGAARRAAKGAAMCAAWNAAWNAARGTQEEMFIKMCNGQAPWQIGVTNA